MVHATESEDHCSDTDSVGSVKRHVAVNIISNSLKNSLHSSTEGVNDRLMSPPPELFCISDSSMQFPCTWKPDFQFPTDHIKRYATQIYIYGFPKTILLLFF